MKIKSIRIAAAIFAATSVSNYAQTVIYLMDYDANQSSWSQGEKIASSSYTYLAGSNSDGVEGSTAFSYHWDATGTSGDLSAKVITKKDDRINAASTANLSQLNLEFSVLAGGLHKATDTFRVAIQFGSTKSNLVDFTMTADMFTDVSLSLSKFTFEKAPTIADINTGLILTFEQWGSADEKWEYDAGNSLILDDIQLVQITP